MTGARRAEQVALHSLSRLLLAVDRSHEPARAVAERFGAAWSTQWKLAVEDDSIDVVIVSLPQPLRCEVASAALRAGKHVLVEVPVGGPADCDAFVRAARSATGVAKAGFTLRYHPAVARARTFVEEGTIGTPASLHVRYLRRYDGEGALADFLARAADLVAWFAGAPERVYAAGSATDAFALLEYGAGRAATIHVSRAPQTESFSLECIGQRGRVAIEGLGAAFGAETFVAQRRDETGGFQEIAREAFGSADVSYALEWDEFVRALHDGRTYCGNCEDALLAANVVAALNPDAS